MDQTLSHDDNWTNYPCNCNFKKIYKLGSSNILVVFITLCLVFFRSFLQITSQVWAKKFVYVSLQLWCQTNNKKKALDKMPSDEAQ